MQREVRILWENTRLGADGCHSRHGATHRKSHAGRFDVSRIASLKQIDSIYGIFCTFPRRRFRVVELPNTQHSILAGQVSNILAQIATALVNRKQSHRHGGLQDGDLLGARGGGEGGGCREENEEGRRSAVEGAKPGGPGEPARVSVSKSGSGAVPMGRQAVRR